MSALWRSGATLVVRQGFRSGALVALTFAAFESVSARADEGGVSFWTSGQYGSFAAIAPSPGWSMPLVFYGYDGSIGAGTQLQRGNLASAGLKSSFQGLFVTPTYTPDAMILGARPSFSLSFAPGYNASTGNVAAGPLQLSRSDSMFGGSDLYPTGQLFWNPGGVNNFMVYLTGAIPVGTYDPNSLASIGIGHAAIDAGGAYTWLNTKTGTEFSATLGFTENFENWSTHYTNGIDSHLDLAASQFLTQQLFVGVVGYYYQQFTADSGQLSILGPNESRTHAGLAHRLGTTSISAASRSTRTCAATSSSTPIAGCKAAPSSRRSTSPCQGCFTSIGDPNRNDPEIIVRPHRERRARKPCGLYAAAPGL